MLETERPANLTDATMLLLRDTVDADARSAIQGGAYRIYG